MSELKTLKDILEKNGIDWEEGDWGETLVEFREEAIKYIKHFEKEGKIKVIKTDHKPVPCVITFDDSIHNNREAPLISVLIGMFNITYEELQ